MKYIMLLNMMKMKNLKKMDKVQEPTIDLRAERLAEEKAIRER